MNAFEGLNLSNQAILVISAVCAVYIITITIFGGYFSRFNRNINDFFYSGQRFSWWLPAISMIATGIGSYSYLKYSEQGFNTGMSSTLTYMNEWFIVPFFMFGWLPIVYYSRVKSIPEYFARRFNNTSRYIALSILLAYMLFYIGYNLYTIGVAFHGIMGVSQLYSVPILALFLGFYVAYGGQTAVIFTDLFQGFMLYLAGALAIGAALIAVGGFGEWWAYLPETHRLPFVHLTEDPKFNTSGLFWGEALAGSIAFTFMNQGFLMRYLTIKSVQEGRKAVVANVAVILPLAAIIVGAVGWVGKAIVMKQSVLGGALPGYNLIEIQNTFHTFLIVCWETVKQNEWLFGFVVAALMAALMSTIDTLINACAAVGIYDLYKPLIKKEADDKHYLKAARWASLLFTFLGALLVILFNASVKSGVSLMSLHYKGVMIIIPSIVTAIFMGAFWKRYNATAACVSMIAGSLLTITTVWYPDWIDPIAWFVSGPQNGIYIYMRALFGMSVTALIGVIVTLITDPPDEDHVAGLTIDTIKAAQKFYKGGGEPNHKASEKVKDLTVVMTAEIPEGWVEASRKNTDRLATNDGDIVYVSDHRWYLGGLRSDHLKIKTNESLSDTELRMSEDTHKKAYLLVKKKADIEKIL